MDLKVARPERGRGAAEDGAAALPAPTMLGDIYYAEVVEALDAKIAADPTKTQLIKSGVADLDKAMGVPFLKLSDEYQLEVLHQHRRPPRSSRRCAATTVVALYNNKNVWADIRLPGQLLPGRRLPLPRLPGRRLDHAAGRRGQPAAVHGLREARTWHDDLRPERRRRRRHRRLRRRRRHAGQRAGAEGHRRRPARGRQAAEHRHLHQRRVGELRPARLARQAHHLGQLAGRRATSRTCRPGSARRSAAPRPTGPAPRSASRSTSSGPRPSTATSTAPTCSTGRSRWPSSSPTTPRPRTRWA